MNDVLTFANTASPLAILAVAVLGLVYAVYKLSRGEDILTKVSTTQDQKYPELQKHFEYLEESYANQKKFQENHSIHEIPAMVDSLDRIEKAIGSMQTDLTDQGRKIARVEGLVDVLRGK